MVGGLILAVGQGWTEGVRGQTKGVLGCEEVYQAADSVPKGRRQTGGAAASGPWRRAASLPAKQHGPQLPDSWTLCSLTGLRRGRCLPVLSAK